VWVGVCERKRVRERESVCERECVNSTRPGVDHIKDLDVLLQLVGEGCYLLACETRIVTLSHLTSTIWKLVSPKVAITPYK